MSVLVNRAAPDFVAPAVLADGSIVDAFDSSSLRGRYVVMFFWPLDFTFVCPSEIIAHNNRMDKFRALGVEVVGVSIDSQFTHFAWRNTPVEQGGIGPVDFTMVADVRHEITRAYGIEHEDWGQEVKAVVVPEPGSDLDPAELSDWCRQTLAGYKVPTSWEIRSEPLPRNPAGKVLKAVLRGTIENTFTDE